MHITMNRFEVENGEEQQFERSLKEHHERLKGTPGYLSFHLIRGGTNGTVTFYSSHTKWNTRQDFLDWNEAEQLLKSRFTSIDTAKINIKKSVLWDRFRTYLKSFYSRAKI